MIPQLILIALTFAKLGLWLGAIPTGKDTPKEKSNEGSGRFIGMLAGSIILHAILYWGGWYDALIAAART